MSNELKRNTYSYSLKNISQRYNSKIIMYRSTKVLLYIIILILLVILLLKYKSTSVQCNYNKIMLIALQRLHIGSKSYGDL